MNWGLAIWTALGWLVCGGLLYLTYKFGSDCSQQVGSSRDAWRFWKNGVLAIMVIVAMVVFGTGENPDQLESSYRDLGKLTTGDWSRALGILIAFVCSYSVGFADGRMARKRQ